MDNTQLCDICGESHSNENCENFVVTAHVIDTEVPTRAKLTLPKCLELKTLADNSYSVFAKHEIQRGTIFGPLVARKQLTLNPVIKFPMKLISKNDIDIKEYYLDTSDENECNWMMFVNSALFLEEQNLICYQLNEEIYFGAISNINPGECLKIWYSPSYALKMKENLLPSSISQEMEAQPTGIDVNDLVKKQHNILSREIWHCKFCYGFEKDVVQFAEHLIRHYRLFERKTCEICNKKFVYKRSLKKHVETVHFHEPYPNIINSVKSDVKKSSKKPKPTELKPNEQKETSLGGPLMNNITSDSLDNSSCFLQQSELSNFDIDNQNILMETDNLLSVDVLNTRDIENINLEVKETPQEQQTCDLCLKSFSTVKNLVRHLEKHTGKHFCTECNKVFGRKESYDIHPCVTFPTYPCSDCEKVFPSQKKLKQHICRSHKKEYKCEMCQKMWGEQYSFKTHKCLVVDESKEPTHKCHICNKTYYTFKNLNDHLRIHNIEENRICPYCSKILSKKRYPIHLKLHEEPSVACDCCNKKFRFKDSLLKHKQTVHNQEEEHICEVCSASYKSKISLAKHKSVHGRKYVCDICHKEVGSKSRLQKHKEKIHTLKGSENDFICPYCTVPMTLRRSLLRHIRKFHDSKYDTWKQNNEHPLNKTKPDNDLDFIMSEKSIDTDQKCRDLKETIDKMNFTINVNEQDNLNLDGTETIDRFLKETSKEIGISDLTRTSDNVAGDNFLKAAENILPQNDGLSEEREVHLSVPDLNSKDANIELGANAYLMENGTIVEPQDNPSNVVVYILNEANVPLKDIVDDIL